MLNYKLNIMSMKNMFLNHFFSSDRYYCFSSGENFILRLNEFYLASVFNLENEFSENNEKLDKTLSK